MRAAFIAIAAGLASGCPSVGAFECVEPSDCDRTRDGVCMDGSCAYPNSSCPSGLEWSPNAANDPSACVDATTETSSTTTGTTTTTTTTTLSTSEESSSSTTEPATTSGPATCGATKQIDIDTGILSATTALENYPLLLAFSDDDLVDADPETIFFTATDDTVLPHDREAFDPATGTLTIWVRLPAWSVGEPLTIALHFGDLASAPDNDPGLVWSPTYLAVWHLGDALDDSDGEVIRNAVTGGEHGFAYGDMTSDQTAEGRIGNALVFDGDDDYVEVSAAFVGALQTFTVSYWSRWDGGLEDGGYFSRLNGEHLYPRCWRIDGSGAPFCQLHSMDTTVGLGGDADSVAPGLLVHMAFSWDEETAITYYDGEVGRTNAMYPGPMPLGGTNPMMIGREFEFGSFNGVLDEFRVSDRALPQAWIEADYRVQSNPSNAILDIDPAEPRPCQSN